MKLSDIFKDKLASALIIVGLVVIFLGGYWTRGALEGRGVTSDTTAVAVKPPPAQVTTNIPAQVAPKIIYRDRVVPDSTALYESAWLQNENATLRDSLDTLMAAKDSLRAKLTVLLAPHVAETTFHFDLPPTGFLNGTAQQAYAPMSQTFGLNLIPTQLSIPVITNTKKPAWWVKPAVFVGGAATAYFVQKENSTGALIAGGASLFIIIVEF